MIMFNLVLASPIGDKWMARNNRQNSPLDDADGIERTLKTLPAVDNSSPAVDKCGLLGITPADS